MSRSPCMREPRRARRLRAMVGLVAGCAVLAGCVSVRPLALVPPAEVSRWMRLAVVDIEDARFWRHRGVDGLAVARAAAQDLERGRVVEG
jgi:membrane carboxypeptidase/penicillin-binding protein